jgi:putative tricarboxylic transport membrane protein
VFLAVTCALLVVQDVSAQRRPAPPAAESQATPAAPPRAYGLVVAAFVTVAAYIVLLPLLGFRIATALFVAAFQLVLERPATARQWLMLAVVAVGTAAVTYIVFDQYLTVLLPRGAWTGW